MNVSIDGIADHNVAAFADDELHFFAIERLNEVDAVLFGRVTYQLFEEFWPIAPVDPRSTKSMVEFAHKINTMPKVVFSNTLQKVYWNNTKLVEGNAVDEVARMKRQPGKGLSVGGISLAQTLMKAGLIDEYWLMVQPVVWGRGKRLFDGLKERANLKLVDTKRFASGVVVLHYASNGTEVAK
jgi:dihydrofolate reductase